VTQRAKEIVAEARLKSPELIARVSCKSVLMSEPCVLADDYNAVTREGQESPPELTALESGAMVESAAGMTASRAAISSSPGAATPAVGLLDGVAQDGVAGSPLRPCAPRASPQPTADRAVVGPPVGMAAKVAGLQLADSGPSTPMSGTGGGPASPPSPPPVRATSVAILDAETVPTSSILSPATAEVPFSRDVGCYTPATSPVRPASPLPMPLVVSHAPPARRSARHAVAEDGSVATDEDTLHKAMRRKAAINLDCDGT
jgi:hypothetical protein